MQIDMVCHAVCLLSDSCTMGYGTQIVQCVFVLHQVPVVTDKAKLFMTNNCLYTCFRDKVFIFVSM